MTKTCDAIDAPNIPCSEEALFAVKVGTLVARYCLEHLGGFLDSSGEETIVFPASASDESVLRAYVAERFP